MAKKPETVFWERIKPQLESIPFTKWFRIQQKSIRGTPDILGSVGGIFVAIELKSEDGIPDPLQKWNLQQVMETGALALSLWPDQWDDVYRRLHELALQQREFVPTIRAC